MMEEKNEIRKIVAGKRAALEQVWIVEASRMIIEQLVLLPAYEGAEVVACYLDIGAEVKTVDLLERCWADGKAVCIPAYDCDVDGYRMAYIDADTNMISGRMRIGEPEYPQWVEIGDVDIFLVPGLAFDRKGGRIGYGGGFYDRLMLESRAVKAALCFDFQVFERVPVDEHDILMNMIITETKVITVD